MAATVSPMMPLEKTSLSPRFMNWRGIRPSRASTEASRGKPVKLVLAARTRMAMVAICRA